MKMSFMNDPSLWSSVPAMLEAFSDIASNISGKLTPTTALNSTVDFTVT